VPAQLLIVAITICAVVALLRYQTATVRHEASGFERWIIGLAVGLLAGWITAASFVGFASTLVTLGWGASGNGAAAGGAGLLLFAGGRCGRRPPRRRERGVGGVVGLCRRGGLGAGRGGGQQRSRFWLRRRRRPGVAAAVMVLVALLLRVNSGRQPLAGAGA
jgi:hypothetical protein